MISEITNQIENINNAISWVKKNRPNDFSTKFLQLVEERRKLRIIANAERNNPGVAAFGQSQVGKSYLMNCILQDGNEPFMVESPAGEQNFVDQINPIGGGQEATGVVTRFSSYKRNPEDYNPDLPIRFRALSVRDIAMIICDTYFNDFSDYTTDGETEISERLQSLCEKYATYEEIANPVLTPDDMLEMKLYFKQHINNAQIFSVRTSFFDRLATIITRIPVADYVSIFSILWHNETEFSNLFTKCIGILQRIHFADYVYLPIEAVVHGGVKEDTIMSVACLKLLYEDRASEFTTDVYLRTDKGTMEKIGKFTKSEMCTICSEVIIRISKRFLESTGRYDKRNIAPENQSKLPSGDVAMTLLNDTDLLDFPGARAREDGKIEKIQNHETLIYSFLRGKIAYLFNKYNEEKAINILLHCHHQKNMDATQMWHLLNSWVNEYVGETPEKRADFIRKTEISPLFHVGTMFNIDLQDSDNKAVGNTRKSILARWNSRFDGLLAQDCFHRQDVEWVNNWDGQNRPFQNCYMLRDFKFSKQIYSGYEDTGMEQSMMIEQTYYDDMREMFIKNNEETHHMFQDAALAWDASASIGNDGALFIIQQLSKVASRIQPARESQIAETLRKVCQVCWNIMKEYFVSTDVDEILDANIRKANAIFRDMEFTCQNEPEYFSHLLQALQITEAESYKEIHRLIPSLTSIVTGTESIKDHELIRKRCNNFEGCATVEDKWERFISCYHFTDKEEAGEFLISRGIDADKLFAGDTIQRKNSAIIANDMLNLWRNNIQGVQFMNTFAGTGMINEIALSNLVSCVINTAENVNLRRIIENQIAEYTDILNTHSINEDLIADMIATTISDFITDFGYRYLTPEQIATSKRVSEERHLPSFDWTERPRQEHFTEEEMTALFNLILSSSDRFTPAYDANYNSWIEYMYIAYIAHINVPDFDRVANDRLKEILDEFKK